MAEFPVPIQKPSHHPRRRAVRNPASDVPSSPCAKKCRPRSVHSAAPTKRDAQCRRTNLTASPYTTALDRIEMPSLASHPRGCHCNLCASLKRYKRGRSLTHCHGSIDVDVGLPMGLWQRPTSRPPSIFALASDIPPACLNTTTRAVMSYAFLSPSLRRPPALLAKPWVAFLPPLLTAAAVENAEWKWFGNVAMTRGIIVAVPYRHRRTRQESRIGPKFALLRPTAYSVKNAYQEANRETRSLRRRCTNNAHTHLPSNLI